VAFKLIRDHNGVCWDGIGVPPDLRIKNTKADMDAEKDRVLEFAIRLLENGNLKPQDEASSLQNIKTSLVHEFAKGVDEVGLEKALARLNKALCDQDEKYFFAPDDIMVLVQEYMRDDKFEEAIAILKVCREKFPHMTSAYSLLAHMYMKVGDNDAAGSVLKAGESVEAMFPWEGAQFERVKKYHRIAVRGSAASMVKEVLIEKGEKAAEEKFNELLSKGEDGPVFDENDFNYFGYKLMQSGNVEAALFIFKKNVRLFPDSANVYDSLAEAYMKAGKNELAVKNYRKSIELNPDNPNARSMIKKLEKE
jgi:tetratricopeptide (TPR) repeat protein